MRRHDQYQRARFRPGDPRGHYESFFLRANHPTHALAFWIRYTVFSPKEQPGKAIGELWAVIANGETGRHVAVKKEMPLSQCQFDREKLAVRIGDATLDSTQLRGAAAGAGHRVGWSLSYKTATHRCCSCPSGSMRWFSQGQEPGEPADGEIQRRDPA